MVLQYYAYNQDGFSEILREYIFKAHEEWRKIQKDMVRLYDDDAAEDYLYERMEQQGSNGELRYFV